MAAINGDDILVFDSADEESLKAEDWLVSIEQMKELHQWTENAACSYPFFGDKIEKFCKNLMDKSF